MKTVTPRAIAYAGVHVHFSLSNAEWKNESEGYGYSEFYNYIIDFFEVTTGPVAEKRIKDLLTWWNNCSSMPKLPFQYEVERTMKAA
ncbi:hypothetical protein BDQ17DRAFT_1420455 [Cyathus striatus]|nr:hypothetical protein BDQ17DRAFT_1420455 [Cyathus striatus]